MTARARLSKTSLNAPTTRRGALGAGLAAALGLLSGQQAEAVQLSGDLLSQPRARLTHHFRRAGFGATRELLDRAPSLSTLQNGNLRYTVDFRSVYASILDNWLGAPAEEILGQRYERLPLVASAVGR